jgi:hypothetical protein
MKTGLTILKWTFLKAEVKKFKEKTKFLPEKKVLRINLK